MNGGIGPSLLRTESQVRNAASRTPLLLAICAVLAGIAASAARAAVVKVNPFLCQTFQGGSQTVPAGSEITIRQGAAEQTLGILTDFINAQTTTITVNGATVDVSNAWPTPEQRPTGDYASFITYPTGITLQAGQSLTVVWVTTVSHVVPEVFNPAGGGEPGKPGMSTDPAIFTCTVTAT